jgi:hypothetical protein
MVFVVLLLGFAYKFTLYHTHIDNRGVCMLRCSCNISLDGSPRHTLG